MSRFLLIAAAFALVLSGCGKEEEQPKMEQTEAPAMEAPSAPAEEATPTAAEAMPGEADMGAAEESMMEEAVSAAEETVAAAEEAAQEVASAAETAVAPEEGNRGKQVYDMVCFACHAQGIAGAPKTGDKAAWEPRIAKGMDTLVNNAINGYQGSAGVMPAKGGRMDLSDEDVKAAVSYMVEQVK